jgi:hypothetical protein
VAPKVFNDATLAKHEFKGFFGPRQLGKVKRTTFEYHLVNAAGYSQNQGLVSLVGPITERASTADIVAFDIEKYSEKSQVQQTKLAERLSRCVELALSTLETPINFGPAGDGGFLAFTSKQGDGAPKAWSFARELSIQAKRESIPIRIGISNGPVLSSSRRALIGGAVLRADEVSSAASTGDIATTREFWSSLAEELRHGWEESPTSDSTVFVVKNESHGGHRPKSNQSYIVGRDEEVDLLKGVMEAIRSPSILNIYGPAGIGKTTLCEKLGDWCRSQQIPSAAVDLYSLFNVTVQAIACKLRDMLMSGDNLHVARWDFQEVQRAFREFDQLVEEHDQIKSAIARHGDVTRVFNKYGFLKERYSLSFAHSVFARREGLEKYLREADGRLAESFVRGVTSLANSRRLVLFVDTWEKLEHSPGVEEWLSTKFLPNLPSGATAVLFGRSQAQKFASRLSVSAHLLEELSEVDSKAYLRHHGLQDHKALDAVFEVTKGYPLCLALACELSRKARSWDAVSKISVAPEAIAEELLKRLLEEEGVEEVRDFLEKGIVAEWFDRGSIRFILGISEARAKNIYQRIRRYSFVRPHPYGLQFHEGIRDILRSRLEAQNKKEYARLTKKWADYFRKSQEAHL